MPEHYYPDLTCLVCRLPRLTRPDAQRSLRHLRHQCIVCSVGGVCTRRGPSGWLCGRVLRDIIAIGGGQLAQALSCSLRVLFELGDLEFGAEEVDVEGFGLEGWAVSEWCSLYNVLEWWCVGGSGEVELT